MENRIFYSEDSTLERKVVETFDGQKEYRTNCRKIRDKYYIKDKQCFFIDNMWYRLSSGLIAFDHEKGEVVKVTDSLIKGIVDFEKGELKTGFFSPNPYKNCNVYKKGHGSIQCINEKILIENGYAEDFSSGIWYSVKEASISSLQTPKNNVDHTSKGYNIEDNVDEFKQKIELYDNYSPELTKDVKRFGKMLGDISFGVELECSKGFLPEHIQNQLGVVICRDGSLNDENGKPGPEFVTIPLKGVKGLQTISNMSKELAKRTALDIKCSLHIHIGNLPTTRMFLVSLYMLSRKLQNEIFQMFPFYKTNPEGIKQKNYNQKLPSLDMMPVLRGMQKEEFDEYINDCYKRLFSWLSEGYYPDQNVNRKLKNHPVAQKWNRHNRYFWINFMNTIFSSRNTIEFRLHTPTTNQQKIVNWLFICNAIVKYATTHSRKILLSKTSLTLNDVLDYYGNTFSQKGKFLSEYLKKYVEERKEAFYKDFKANDKISQWDIDKDKEYVFNFNGVTHLF